MAALDLVGRSVAEGFAMFWGTLWALVLGFTLSGAVQAFVARSEMRRVLGDHRPRTVAKASFFGAISSSCSYAASALAKSLFARGADFTSVMVFMFASTNLVVELGLVLWLLIGWQFAVAEFFGGALMIALLTLVLPRAVPAAWLAQARDRLDAGESARAQQGDAQSARDPVADGGASWRERIRSRGGWADAAGYAISDLTMLRKELLAGFVIAGFATMAVPTWFWRSLFVTGHGFWSTLENVAVGPFLAIISFVCSVGNVPLAAALWSGGITFGGTIAFVFADLVTLPLLLIYRKYYGTPLTLRLLAVFWTAMSLAGLGTEYVFKAATIAPTSHPAKVAAGTHVGWNYSTVLDIVALIALGLLYWLYRHRVELGGGTGYANDVVCGMQVEKATAPAHSAHGGDMYWFCSDKCRERFEQAPERYASDRSTGSAAGTPRRRSGRLPRPAEQRPVVSRGVSERSVAAAAQPGQLAGAEAVRDRPVHPLATVGNQPGAIDAAVVVLVAAPVVQAVEHEHEVVHRRPGRRRRGDGDVDRRGEVAKDRGVARCPGRFGVRDEVAPGRAELVGDRLAPPGLGAVDLHDRVVGEHAHHVGHPPGVAVGVVARDAATNLLPSRQFPQFHPRSSLRQASDRSIAVICGTPVGRIAGRALWGRAEPSGSRLG